MSKTNLTDIQRAVLQAAARSASLVAWPLPPSMKLGKGTATLVAKGLLKRGLIEERPALGSDPVWRESENGRALTLVVSKAGMAAVGMVPDGGQGGGATELASPAMHPRTPRAGTKLAALVGLLTRDEGATVEEMVTATGWQAHTVRGVMSGALAKKFGLTIVSEKVEGRGRVYRTR